MNRIDNAVRGAGRDDAVAARSRYPSASGSTSISRPSDNTTRSEPSVIETRSGQRPYGSPAMIRPVGVTNAPGAPRRLARCGMLRIRSCSSAIATRTRSWFSASVAVVDTSWTSAGCAVCSGPLMSIAPRIAPVSGSCTGAATHVHAWKARTRCSAEWIVTGASTASVVPIAFVPIDSSLTCVPGKRPTRSASTSNLDAPSRHRMWPSASVTSITCIASSAMLTNVLRSSGITEFSGWSARNVGRSSEVNTTGGFGFSGSTCAARLRCHDAEMIGRGDAPSPPRADDGPPAAITSSKTSDRTRARATGSATPRLSGRGLDTCPLSRTVDGRYALLADPYASSPTRVNAGKQGVDLP